MVLPPAQSPRTPLGQESFLLTVRAFTPKNSHKISASYFFHTGPNYFLET